MRDLAVALAVALMLPTASRAQGLFERLGLDRLRFGGLSLDYGTVQPVNIIRTRSYALQADYGELANHVRVLFGVAYWRSRYTDAVVNGFVQQLQHSITDPTGDDTIHADKVRVSDVSLEGEMRWTPASRRAFARPYLGGGLGMHFVSAQSKLIDNTFIGRSLNDIALGVSAVAGVELAPWRQVGLGVEARYALLPGVTYGTVRAVFTYHFVADDAERRP
ncbi:MAG TPA: hypothetical protein VIC55_01415 [Gemmatimonadaceae bacterium]